MKNTKMVCVLVLLLLPLLGACSVNATDEMRARFLSADLKPEKRDLYSGNNCQGKEILMLVNAQKEMDTEYVFFKNMGHSHYFIQSEFVNFVIKHLEGQLLKGGVPVLIEEDFILTALENRLSFGEITRKEFEKKRMLIAGLAGKGRAGKSKKNDWRIKAVEISLEQAFASYSSPDPEIVSIKIEIPMLNFTEVYTGEAHSSDFYKVMAYATHNALAAFIQDPLFSKFMKCQN